MLLEATKTEKLQRRIDDFVRGLGDDFAPEIVARALIAKGANIILAESGATSAIWTVDRIRNLLAGRWVPETERQFIETPNR